MSKFKPHPRRIDRREFIALGAAGLGALSVSRAIARELGDGRRPYAERSPFEHAARSFGTSVTPGTGSARTPLQDLCGTITPSSLHFEIDRRRTLKKALYTPLIFWYPCTRETIEVACESRARANRNPSREAHAQSAEGPC